LKATRNALLTELDLVGIVATSGVTGDAASPTGCINSNLIGGYSTLVDRLFSRKYPTYSVGIQLNLPVRNRIAQADLTRAEFSQREMEARRQQLINQVRLEVEDALVGLRRSRAPPTKPR
jgi:outer membrane protein